MSSRFATVEEVTIPEFSNIWENIAKIHKTFGLPDHMDVNLLRYPWSAGLLSPSAPYAARLWEYPFAIVESNLSNPNLKCADIGCGMTAFTIYLKDFTRCEVTGIDSDVFETGIKYKGHGVSRSFLKNTGINFIRSSMTDINTNPETFDRVFCISVLEHLPRIKIPQAMREMTRILKPGGLLVLTMDVNIFTDITNPLSIIWDSGLVPYGNLDLQWPTKRFGIFNNGTEPADVYGLVLRKPVNYVSTNFFKGKGYSIPQSEIPDKRHQAWIERPFHIKAKQTLKKYILGR